MPVVLNPTYGLWIWVAIRLIWWPIKSDVCLDRSGQKKLTFTAWDQIHSCTSPVSLLTAFHTNVSNDRAWSATIYLKDYKALCSPLYCTSLTACQYSLVKCMYLSNWGLSCLSCALTAALFKWWIEPLSQSVITAASITKAPISLCGTYIVALQLMIISQRSATIMIQPRITVIIRMRIDQGTCLSVLSKTVLKKIKNKRILTTVV